MLSASWSHCAAEQAPVTVAPPTVTGVVATGETLAVVTAGKWTGDLPLSYAYQWTRGGADISGATSATYSVAYRDVGTVIACRVTATNHLGSSSAMSAPARAVVNLAPFSQALGSWAADGTTVTDAVAADPVTGLTTADRILETETMGQHSRKLPAIAFLDGSHYTFSVYVKHETMQFVQLLLGAAAFGVGVYANFDLINGMITGRGGATTASIVSAGDGWYRLSVSGVASATASATGGLYGIAAGTDARAPSYAGSVSKTTLAACAMVEQSTTAHGWVPGP